jgi:GH25 family lysozyme M1 (1,4-beta-N-acetylmuramidase)
MRRHFIAKMLLTLIAGVMLSGNVAAQEQDEIDPALLRPYWVSGESPVPAAAPYTLTPADRKKFNGSFGLDLSHYTFDIDNSPSSCRTPQGYPDKKCSCTMDWKALSDNGLLYIYSKASDATGTDLSFARVWSELKSRHEAKTLFRGAFHFLRPGVSADAQAKTFLNAVGAVDGKKPVQLPPALDIEWSNKQVILNSPEYAACPSARRLHVRGKTPDKDRYYCDMWYKVPALEIATMARTWIDLVEKATGQRVIIYTNPTAWWNPFMKERGLDLMTRQAVWTSRYTSQGPQYDPAWNTEEDNNGERRRRSKEWGMAPLPVGAIYPNPDLKIYDVPHFWQFTENGYLPSNVLTCDGTSKRKDMDMNWLPISNADYPNLFGVASQ